MSSFNYTVIISGFLSGLIFLGFVYYCFFVGIKIFVVSSGSMIPKVNPGSLIITQPQQKYYSGQIISFKVANHFFNSSLNNLVQQPLVITHRVISRVNTGNHHQYITQGDANHLPDRFMVHHADVIGKVILTVPFLGSCLLWIYSKLGFYCLVVFPVSLIITYQLKTIICLVLNVKNSS